MVSDSVKRTLRMVQDATSGKQKPSVFWHIWDAPLITIARGSYMNELLEIAGATNIYGDLTDASPMVSIEESCVASRLHHHGLRCRKESIGSRGRKLQR